MPETTHEVVVVGSGSAGQEQLGALRDAGVTDVVLLEEADGAIGATWDEQDRTWTVHTRGGTTWHAHFLVGVAGPGSDDGTDALDRLEITGRGGRRLREVWAEHGRVTHLGVTVSDFPNLFLLLGPDTGLGHDPVAVLGCQTRYVAQAITTVRTSGMSGLDVRAEVQQRSAADQRRRDGRPGGYLDLARYRWRTRRFRPADFELFGRAADAAATPTPEEAADAEEAASTTSAGG